MNFKSVTIIQMKTCSKCKEEKDESCFRKRLTGKGGISSSCAKCDCIRENNWRSKNKESVKKSREKGKEKLLILIKNWRIKNKDKMREYAKKVKENLPDFEIINRLKSSKYPKELINNKDFIEIKRIIIKTKRLCKTLSN